MRLYQVAWQDPHNGAIVEWFGSAGQAKARCVELRRLDQDYNPECHAVEVPTDKKGLIDWLNANLETDNAFAGS